MLNERSLALTGSQTSGMRNRARKLRAQGIQVVNFAAGELDQDTFPAIKDAVKQAVDAGKLDKLTIKLEPAKMAAEEEKTKTEVIARVNDEPNK